MRKLLLTVLLLSYTAYGFGQSKPKHVWTNDDAVFQHSPEEAERMAAERDRINKENLEKIVAQNAQKIAAYNKAAALREAIQKQQAAEDKRQLEARSERLKELELQQQQAILKELVAQRQQIIQTPQIIQAPPQAPTSFTCQTMPWLFGTRTECH